MNNTFKVTSMTAQTSLYLCAIYDYMTSFSKVNQSIKREEWCCEGYHHKVAKFLYAKSILISSKFIYHHVKVPLKHIEITCIISF